MTFKKIILLYKVSTATVAVIAEVLIIRKAPFSLELFMTMTAVFGLFALVSEGLNRLDCMQAQLDVITRGELSIDKPVISRM